MGTGTSTTTERAPTAPVELHSMRAIAQPLREAFVRRVIGKVTAGEWAPGPAALGLDMVGLNGSVVHLTTAVCLAEAGKTSDLFAQCVTELAKPSVVDDPDRCDEPTHACDHGGTEMLCTACWDCHECAGAPCREALLRELEDGHAEVAGLLIWTGILVGCLTSVLLLAAAWQYAPRLPGALVFPLLGLGVLWFVEMVRGPRPDPAGGES